MRYLIVTGNPKKEGLCFSATEEIARGAKEAGAEVSVLDVSSLIRCKVCGNGWGSCRETHACAFGADGFHDAQAAVREADQICLITPVYWGEMAEGLKCFIDRLRRCEFGQNGALSGKPVLLVASPGGSGNGALSCLEQMDRFCRHTGAQIFDYISLNRWNNDYKRQALYAAAKAMAAGRKAGESL
ncbi:MAG: flavodoxin family protein [Christensenellaceae bacterium]|jgi:multimeric flavodoxin WrbA|nr:flavodoxin family protein [Christensenellaceae bacterium]